METKGMAMMASGKEDTEQPQVPQGCTATKYCTLQNVLQLESSPAYTTFSAGRETGTGAGGAASTTQQQVLGCMPASEPEEYPVSAGN